MKSDGTHMSYSHPVFFFSSSCELNRQRMGGVPRHRESRRGGGRFSLPAAGGSQGSRWLDCGRPRPRLAMAWAELGTGGLAMSRSGGPWCGGRRLAGVGPTQPAALVGDGRAWPHGGERGKGSRARPCYAGSHGALLDRQWWPRPRWHACMRTKWRGRGRAVRVSGKLGMELGECPGAPPHPLR
jgi:hypothetical protein